MMALYTWRDVERQLRTIDSPPWIDFSVDLETLALTCRPGDTRAVKECLSSLFGYRFATGEGTLLLESLPDRPRRLAVLIEEDQSGTNEHRIRIIRPLWPDAGEMPDPLSPLPKSPALAAFYSYKGGVGRSTTLLATLGAILERPGRTATVLVIDADIEAPGLTLDLRGPPDRFSLLDFLSLVHDAEDWRTEVLSLAAERLAKNREQVELPSGRASFYFLPAHRDSDQLFAPPVTLEQLVRARHRAHVVAEAIAALGAEIGAQAVLVDLRAGVSELASPLMLDPRVQTILVTSCSQQSFDGTISVLHRLSRRARRETRPVVVLSLIPPGFSPEDVAERVGQLAADIPPPSTEEDPAAEMAENTVLEAEFAQELLHYPSVEDLLAARLPGTDLGKQVGPALARLLVPMPEEPRESVPLEDIPGSPPLSPVGMQAVAETAKQIEYAEGNAEPGLLATSAVVDLVTQFSHVLPAAVVLGAKGAGKTFAWGQMVLAGDWLEFAQRVGQPWDGLFGPHYHPPLVFPLLYPSNLDPALSQKVREAEQAVWKRLGHVASDAARMLAATALSAELGQANLTAGDELLFWTQRIAYRLGLEQKAGESVSSLAEALAQRRVAVCLAIDGLEEAFHPSPTHQLSSEQQRVLRGLLQRLTSIIRDLQSPNLGVVTFIRRDLAEDAIAQNFGQFESLHQKFVLNWNSTEVLRLVAWLLDRARWPLPLAPTRIPVASHGELRKALASFWGNKLGPDHSKEAFTDRWVIAALSDFQGRLQARDLVRLMRHAAELALNERRLTPRSLRSALIRCSRSKIDELEREIPDLKSLFGKLRDAPEDKKRIPFVGESLGLDREEVLFLERQGVLLQHRGELYLPEIVRHGLNFKLESGRRAKVLALYRAAQARRLVDSRGF